MVFSDGRVELKQDTGYSLVEILIALMIMAMVVTPLMGMMVTSHYARATAGRKTEAANLAREKMEAVKAEGFEATYQAYQNGNYPQKEDGQAKNSSGLPPEFTRKTRVTPEAMSVAGLSDDLSLFTVEVEVTWEEREEKRSLSLVSYLSRR